MPAPTDPRIVSLLPSATEIVAALGLEDALVGRSHECDFPAGVAALPVCTEPLIDPGAPSEEIHASVEALLSRALSVYRVDADRLRLLRPTHVVTQVQCEVCAVSLEQVERALAGWTGDPAPGVVPLTAARLEEVYDDVRRVATALGVAERGERLVATMRRRLDDVADATRDVARRPRVATIEWLSPLMSAGNWIPELVAIAGGDSVFGERGRHSPR
ncbi:MAG TPA: ABC transporter substrate-binding protein, partial [Thermoanaerobaculia bacterium]|nr:ABC transporter substrate-binding protein [Thermoanaerobaculia bacterium]